MTNRDIAQPFDELAKLLEYHGENHFKTRSYKHAYDVLRKRDAPVSGLDEAHLQQIEGVGKAISQKIRALVETGTFPLLERMRAETPAAAVELLGVRGLGAKKVRQLVTELGVESLGELLQAIRENRVAGLRGFSAKSQDKLREQLEFFERSRGKARYADVESLAEDLLRAVRTTGARAELTGAIRRQCPVLESVELLASPEARELLLGQGFTEVTSGSDVERLPALEGTWDSFPVRVTLTPQQGFTAALLLTTGSAGWLAERGALAAAARDTQEDEEASIFDSTGLAYVTPPQREADGPDSPTRADEVIQLADIRGVVHAHTTASDGSATLPELARACLAAGYTYLTVTDHSRAAGYAHGLSPERLAEQGREIERVQAGLPGLRLFRGTECDIMRDGSLDFDDDVLATLDLVIASVHSVLHMGLRDATDRLLAAVHNPYTTMLGHPTGRLLLGRAGYPVAMEEVLDACAANEVSVEINANPNRLDLDWRYVRMAVERGVRLSINPDAHSTAGITDIRYGVLVAQKAGLRPAECLNTLGANAFTEYLAARKHRRLGLA